MSAPAGEEDTYLGHGGSYEAPVSRYGSLPAQSSVAILDTYNRDSHLATDGSFGTTVYGDETKTLDNDILAESDEIGSSFDHQMALYEDDLHEQGRLSHILSRIKNYQAGLAPDPNANDKLPQKESAKMGTVMGVYLPCIQNIFGVILFVRMMWIIGMAGILQGFFIIFMCCLTTLLTAISMSAIATNGVVPGGGAYFMISRALGPEFGGAVGVLFYLGTTVASSMYIIGAVEILINYMAPVMSMFGDVSIAMNAFNNYRVYGTLLLLLLMFCLFFGMRVVSIVAPVSLFCVVLSILAIYIGIFAANEGNSEQVCLLGNRLLAFQQASDGGTLNCTKDEGGPLFRYYCDGNSSMCDPFFEQNSATAVAGIPGLASGVFKDNINDCYTENGNIPCTKTIGNRDRGEIVADISTSFYILLAIFFPSVSGIMAGSNRSGDLMDAQKSIPSGTLGAIATTSFVYLSCVLLFGGTVLGELMRDKIGESVDGGAMIVAHLAWPHPWVILIGSFLSTVGAGLQTLVGAPRLLQAIAKDGVIPFLNVFAVTTRHGEPMRAILLTTAISEIGILVASLDYIAPVITMFFLMCYGFVNLACALQTLLRTPNWRPRFRFYHWTLSLLGLALCVALMFMSSWYYALVAIVLAICVYKYIEYKGAEKEWGDGIRGLAMSAARYALLNLEQGPPHTKNWRPQLLVLMKMDENLNARTPLMVTFATQLKAGKGLMLVASVLEGSFKERVADAQAAKQSLNQVIEKTGTKAFADVIVCRNVTDGLCDIIQTAGLGGLKHNTVVMGWPYGWRHHPESGSFNVFLDTVKNVNNGQHCLLVIKGADHFPESSGKLSGTIDIWWIVHEGGLLMLLPFLLRQHKTWKNCRLRIFTVAQSGDCSLQMKMDLEHYLYQLRIEAEVVIVEMADSDISAYTYERTRIMEQRTQIFHEIRGKKKRKTEPQFVMEKARSASLERSSEDGESDIIYDSATNTAHNSRPMYTYSQPGAGEDGDVVVNSLTNITPSKRNVRRMHTAVRLNETIVEQSHAAQLVILNMPAPPHGTAGEESYMEYLEVLTEGLERVLMVRGSGREVITIYS